MFSLLVACLLLQVLVAAAGCSTDDGDVPFTKALYDKGESEYKKATCIAQYEFCPLSSYSSNCKYTGSGDITITGLPLLKSIGNFAFYSFKGVVVFKGEYPRLETIGTQAFSNVQGSSSEVAFQKGLPLLQSIGS